MIGWEAGTSELNGCELLATSEATKMTDDRTCGDTVNDPENGTAAAEPFGAAPDAFSVSESANSSDRRGGRDSRNPDGSNSPETSAHCSVMFPNSLDSTRTSEIANMSDRLRIPEDAARDVVNAAD
jgi:hypothetical protein